LHPHLSFVHLFGARLREYRVDRGLSQRALGRLVHVSGDLIGKIEKGERSTNQDLAHRCDKALGADGRLADLWSAIDAQVHGAPIISGAVERDAVMARLRPLRRVLDAHDLPSDGPVPDLGNVRKGARRMVEARLASQYLSLATELPALMSAHLRAFHASAGPRRAEFARLLTQVFRAADAIADKFALHDLSARIIGMMAAIATESGDEATVAAAAYVRAEVFFANEDWETGRRMLERAAGSLPSVATAPLAAAYGALHMRAAVLAARARCPDRAADHITEAASVAAHTPDGIYTGTAFGPTSVRIHQVSLAVDSGRPDQALGLATDWVPPLDVPAERRSHFFVDLADASAACGRLDEALKALQVARRIAPQHVRFHPQVRTTLLAIAERSTRSSAPLRDLTRWAAVDSHLTTGEPAGPQAH
jgi:DNA-binding XRE family transcriptional regulator